MEEFRAPALRADWLNAWLAAIGVTVLLPEIALSWTRPPSWSAVFSGPQVEHLPSLIASVLPTDAEVEALAIGALPQNPTGEQYRDAAEKARERGDASLAVLVTDLGKASAIEVSPFAPGAPGGQTLAERLKACLRAEPSPRVREDVESALVRGGRRAPINGLGFDYRRLLSPIEPSPTGRTKWCDPVVEALAFFGLILLPIRGDGRRAPATRGWAVEGRTEFTWPTWEPALGAAEIDGLLDCYWAGRSPVTGAFRTVAFMPKEKKDPTRAYASERIS